MKTPEEIIAEIDELNKRIKETKKMVDEAFREAKEIIRNNKRKQQQHK